MAVFAVNFNLLREWELNTKSFVSILLNFLSVAGLLIAELVARKAYDLESFVLKFIVNLN